MSTIRVLLVVALLAAVAACFSPVDAQDGGMGGGSAAGSTGGGSTAGGSTAGGSTAGGSTAGGSTAGGSTAGGSTGGGSTAGGSTAGGSTAGGSTAGGSTAGGSTAGGSTAGGSTAGGSTAGGAADGGPFRTCSQIENEYNLALTDARRCAPMLPVVQCTGRRALVLGCPQCTTSVERVATLDSLTGEFAALNCIGGSCPFVCNNPPNSVCTPSSAGTTGTCEDRP